MKIQVTEEHIKKGIPEHCQLCAVSLAVQEKVGKKYSVFVMAHEKHGYYFDIYQKGKSRWEDNKLVNKGCYKNNKIVDNKRKLFHFISDFDLFGYNKEKQESIPCSEAVGVKPFEFELEIKGRK